MANYLVTDSQLTSVADAIRAKTGANGGLSFPSGMTTAIGSISTGTSTSVQEKDVKFIDYDGTIVASYSAASFASLSAMPGNPTHTGLIAQGWNWSLADAKTYVAKHGKLNIGQMYVTQSGATEIDVEMHKERLDPILTICANGTITVDWGDNTTPDTVTGTSLTTQQAVPHTYASEGNYTISILATGNNKYSFYGTSNSTILRKNTNTYENRVYANTVKQIRIGNNVEIGDNAFYNCYSLSSITISNSVTNIGSSAFYYCYSLSSITIPDSVTSIKSNAFTSCYSLACVTIPDDVTSIGNNAFTGCYSLFNVTIPDSVTSIGSSAFSNCYSLSSVIMPDDVTSIGSNAFSNCYSLSSVTIPNIVTSIGTGTFQNCYPLSSITIPNKVTSIGNYAFRYCHSLLSITIPDKVTSIGNDAFAGCYGVKEYHILPTTVPTGGTTMFANIPSDCIIYVPYSADHSVLEAYKAASIWSTYASYMQEELAP